MNRPTDEAPTAERPRAGRMPAPFPFARMLQHHDALDRLDLRFRWGRYGLRVLRCHLAVFDGGSFIAAHKHSEFEFHFIPKGRGKVHFADRSCDLQEGDWYLTGPDVVHSQQSDPEEPMHELCLHCDFVPLREAASDWGAELEAADAEACVQALLQAPQAILRDDYDAMAAFLEAYRLWEEQPVGYYTLLRQAFIDILLRAGRVIAGSGAPGAIPERDMDGHRYRLATQYIRDNESLPLSLDVVAERAGVSARQLQRIFRREGQTTFSRYVEHVRLTAVSADLVRTGLPVEEIALRHGFATPNYLYPLFKLKYGMTPSDYRRAHVQHP